MSATRRPSSGGPAAPDQASADQGHQDGSLATFDEPSPGLAEVPPHLQAVKAAKEQTAKASQKLAAARPGGTTRAAPPIGAPPGPVLAEVTELPQDNDSGDGKPGPKPDTQTETATAEPPTSQ